MLKSSSKHLNNDAYSI